MIFGEERRPEVYQRGLERRRLFLRGDQRFESRLLQRRVCKLSVPLRNLPQLLRSEFWHGPTQFGEGFSQATTMLQPVGGS